jgi:hypothetical protein
MNIKAASNLLPVISATIVSIVMEVIMQIIAPNEVFTSLREVVICSTALSFATVLVYKKTLVLPMLLLISLFLSTRLFFRSDISFSIVSVVNISITLFLFGAFRQVYSVASWHC